MMIVCIVLVEGKILWAVSGIDETDIHIACNIRLIIHFTYWQRSNIETVIRKGILHKHGGKRSKVFDDKPEDNQRDDDDHDPISMLPHLVR